MLPLVEKLLDVWTLRSLGLRDRTPLLQGSWGVAEASAENLKVIVALVPQLGVGCRGSRMEKSLVYSAANHLCGPQGGRSRGCGDLRCRPTDWGELGGTKRTRYVVHVGRGHLPLASLASSFATIWDILLSSFDSSVEEGDGGGSGGGGGEDGFTVDCRRARGSERMRTLHSVFLLCGDNRTLVHLPALTAALLPRDP